MIFDADTHMSPYKNFEGSIDAAQWAVNMDAAGIDRALCWLLPQGVEDVSESNRYLYSSSKKYAKMLPFGWANIREGIDKALFDAQQCIEEFGFCGVKLNGAQNEYPIDSLDAMRVAGEVARLGGILAYHIGADAPDYTSPERAAKVAKAFPGMKILMVHMGGAGLPDCSEAVIEVAQQNPNMVLIGSAIAPEKVARAIRTLGSERVMFGSDLPFADPGKCLLGYAEMLKGFEKHDADNVLWNTAARVFSL